MNFTHKQTGRFLILEASGRLDVANGAAFEKEIQQCLNEGNSRIVIDMAGVDYINSAGLRSIMTVAKEAKSRKSEIQFCGLRGIVEEVFKISGFKSMFKTFESIAAVSSE